MRAKGGGGRCEINNMFFSSALASRAIEQTGSTARELVLVDPDDGSDLLFEFLTVAGEGIRQEDSALVSVLRNVTDLGQARRELEENYRRLHMAEAAARAERNRLDLIVDSVVDPIIVSDPTGDILMTNRRPSSSSPCRPTAARPEAQRRVSSNEAHFSSFVSSLLLSGAIARWRGRVALADPATGRMVPVEAVAGKMMSDQAELTAVVTVFHDQTEAIEKERLYERAAARVRSARSEGAGGDRGTRTAERAAAQSGDRARAGLGREVAVPGQHLARVPHAAQRDPRLHVDAAATAPTAKCSTRTAASSRASTRTAATCWR